MAFARQTLASLRQTIYGNFQARLPGVDNTLRRAVLRIVAYVLAGLFHAVYGYLDFLAVNLLPDTVHPFYLPRWMAIKGLAPLGPSFAGGNFVFDGIAGTAIPALTVLTSTDGLNTRYETTVAGTLVGLGNATIPIVALVAGSAGNQPAGATLALAVAVANVNGTGSVDANGLTGGTDSESLASQSARLLANFRTPPQGGNANDYVQWLKTLPGITRAWCLPKYRGASTVDVTFVMDGRANIFPLAADVLAAQTYLSPLPPAAPTGIAPIDADVLAWAPAADALALTIHGLVPNTAAVKAAIAAAFADFLRAVAQPQPTTTATSVIIAFADIDAVIAAARGPGYHLLVAPAADHIVPVGAITVPGAITYT